MNLRVLVVDDNQDAADSCRILLSVYGFETRVVYRAEDALAALPEFDPQLAFLDIGMPGMDGRELARRIRAEHDGEVKLVSVSGWGKPEDVAANLAAGFDEHLTKPAKIEDVVRIAAARALEVQPRDA